MDISGLAKLPILDCHTHFEGEDLNAIDGMLEQEAASGIDQISILISSFPGRVNANPEGLYAKARHQEKVYLFAGLDYSAIAKDVDHRWTSSLAQQVDQLAAMGCDGIKMLNGKPNYRQSSGLALDCVIYDDYFARLEERGFPVLWHVNDPEEFWNPDEAPEWANEMSRGHVFEEAEEYLVPEAPDWLDMDFLGFRLWTDDRRGGPDAGLRTFAFAHRAVVANRYHLQLAYQECPEAREGSRRDRPMELRRQLVELGAPVSRNLRARARYLSDASTVDPRSHEQTLMLGLLGRLADEESVEASVSCTTERWDEESRDRTSVSLLYSCRLDEERRMSLRMGYSWGEDEPGAREREGRLDFSYHKPI